MATDEQILQEAREVFAEANEAESENRDLAKGDKEFARLGRQWDDEIAKRRKDAGRPCLTINRLPSFIRQIVNDARQNTPQIKVRPVDGGADIQTAQIYEGLIRHIESISNADTAYDTAIDDSVTQGFGYWRIDVDFAHSQSFEKEIFIRRVPNAFSVYGDPWSIEADSSDWNHGFVTDVMPMDQFEKKYPGANTVDFKDLEATMRGLWLDGDSVTVAEYWRREEAEKDIVLMSNGQIIDKDILDGEMTFAFEMLGIHQVDERKTASHKVKHFVMSGVEVLEQDDWEGEFIPIIPVYGEEVNEEGKRHFRSLIRDAKHAQVMFNVWRSTTTELVALAPKAPWIGPKGAFDHDRDRWETANTENYAFLEYEGPGAPTRVPFDSAPAGALQESLNANDDMKAIMGLHDASLGIRSNEIAGIAIEKRQREGDVSTFHFHDNQARSIRHTGRVLVDLIPHVYTGRRIIRILGEDGATNTAEIGPQVPGQEQAQEQQEAQERAEDIARVYDLGVGKFDVDVSAGPSFTTRRVEAAEQMMEMMRAFPAAAPIMGDLLAKNLDWPGAEEIARRLQTLLPSALKGQDPMVAQLSQQLEQLKGALAAALDEKSIDQAKVAIDQFEAETDRIKTLGELQQNAEKQVFEARKQVIETIPQFNLVQ